MISSTLALDTRRRPHASNPSPGLSQKLEKFPLSGAGAGFVLRSETDSFGALLCCVHSRGI